MIPKAYRLITALILSLQKCKDLYHLVLYFFFNLARSLIRFLAKTLTSESLHIGPSPFICSLIQGSPHVRLLLFLGFFHWLPISLLSFLLIIVVEIMVVISWYICFSPNFCHLALKCFFIRIPANPLPPPIPPLSLRVIQFSSKVV